MVQSSSGVNAMGVNTMGVNKTGSPPSHGVAGPIPALAPCGPHVTIC